MKCCTALALTNISQRTLRQLAPGVPQRPRVVHRRNPDQRQRHGIDALALQFAPPQSAPAPAAG